MENDFNQTKQIQQISLKYDQMQNDLKPTIFFIVARERDRNLDKKEMSYTS